MSPAGIGVGIVVEASAVWSKVDAVLLAGRDCVHSTLVFSTIGTLPVVGCPCLHTSTRAVNSLVVGDSVRPGDVQVTEDVGVIMEPATRVDRVVVEAYALTER